MEQNKNPYKQKIDLTIRKENSEIVLNRKRNMKSWLSYENIAIIIFVKLVNNYYVI